MSHRVKLHLAAISLGLLLSFLNQPIVIGLVVEDSELDVSFLSALRYELRKAPKLTQCLHYWKVLDLKIRGEPTLDERPIIEQIDTELLMAVSAAMRHRIPIVGTNNLVEYIDECAAILDQEVQRRSKSDQSESRGAKQPTNDDCDRKELENRANQLREKLELMSSHNEHLLQKVSSLESAMETLGDRNRFLQAQLDLMMMDTDLEESDNRENVILMGKLNEELAKLERRKKADQKVKDEVSWNSDEMKRKLKIQALRMQTLENEIDRLNRHSNLQTQVLSSWGAEKDALKTQIKGGTEQVKQLNAANDQLRKRLERLENVELENKELRNQMKNLKAQKWANQSYQDTLREHLPGLNRLFTFRSR